MIVFFATLAVFIFPGLAILLRWDVFPTDYISEKIPLGVALSLAWWIIGFWFLRIAPIPLHMFVILSLVSAVFLIALSLLAPRREKKISPAGSIRTDIVILLFFLILLVPGSLIATRQIGPTGQDMSMHSYLATIIYHTDGFPKTMRPIVPSDQFGYYPVGFPTVMAVMMTINRLPVITNGLWLTILTYWLFAVSLYTLIRTRYSVFVSMLVTIVMSWGNAMPNDIIVWGSNPTVLSLDFLILSVSALPVRKHAGSYIVLFIFFYASFLTHYMLPVALIYLALTVSPFFGRAMTQCIRFVQKHPASLIITLIATPFLWHIYTYTWYISNATKLYVAGLQRNDLSAWVGAPGWEIVRASFQFLTSVFSGPVLISYTLSILVIALVNKRHAALHIVSFLGIIILIVNSRYWWLPLSAILYPDRVILFEIIPISLGLAEASTIVLNRTYKYFILHRPRNYFLLHVIAIAVVVYAFGPGIRVSLQKFLTSADMSVITKDDLQAFAWIRERTNPTDVIMNNYYDAGIWIPAVATRSITTYHTNPIDMDLINANVRQPDYAYIGNKSLVSAGTDRVDEEVARHPEKYVLVYEAGSAKIYRVRRAVAE